VGRDADGLAKLLKGTPEDPMGTEPATELLQLLFTQPCGLDRPEDLMDFLSTHDFQRRDLLEIHRESLSDPTREPVG